jgi:transcriptional regulator with XRE-family HTH domain
MATKQNRILPKQTSLSWLEEIYFTEGSNAAKEAFQRLLPDADLRSYYLQRPVQGQLGQKNEAQSGENAAYKSFSPPALWNVPYSVLRVHFDAVPRTDFVYHRGEELLVPISGRMQIHFFCNSDGKKAESRLVEKLITHGSAIRINPQLPHHAWAVDESGAEAWMILQHLKTSESSIRVNYEWTGMDLHSAPRSLRVNDLTEPGRYALIAWGLAEKIKSAREQANLRAIQAANACGIEASMLSRIENAESDVPIEILIRIATFLRIGIDNLIAPAPWQYDIFSLSPAEKKSANPLEAPFRKPPGCDHCLHPSWRLMPAGSAIDIEEASWFQMGAIASWIMLSGRIIVTIKGHLENSLELLEEGSVIHFRRASPIRIHALENSEIMQVVHSTNCTCAPAH